jgi:hypothetical protein
VNTETSKRNSEEGETKLNWGEAKRKKLGRGNERQDHRRMTYCKGWGLMLQRTRWGNREGGRDKYLTQSTVSNASPLLSEQDADPNLTSITFAHS